MDEKQPSWIAAHVHMYEYFGGVAKNPCAGITAALPWITTRVGRISGSMLSIRKWLNTMALQSYQPRVRAPRDKANAEGSVGNISTWITAALRNEQFFLPQ